MKTLQYPKVLFLLLIFALRHNAEARQPYVLSFPLSLTYYPSFTAAIQDLQNLGITDPVSFEVASGSYVEQILIGSIAGTSTSNQVHFYAASGQASDVVLSFSASQAANYVMKLDGTDHFIFEHISFRADNASYALVWLSW